MKLILLVILSFTVIITNSIEIRSKSKESKNVACNDVFNNLNTLKLIQTSSKGVDACQSYTDNKDRSDCQELTQFMQTMVKSGDMIPIIEKLRKIRRDLERIEKEFDEERRRKVFYDKTKTQLLFVVNNIMNELDGCQSGCRNWCNEMILVLITKLKISQQRLVQVRISLLIMRKKIALLIIEIQWLKIIIQKMIHAILWLYSKIIMILHIIEKIKGALIYIKRKICVEWVQVIKTLIKDLQTWCEEDFTAIRTIIDVDYRQTIHAESLQFKWATYSESLSVIDFANTSIISGQ